MSQSTKMNFNSIYVCAAEMAYKDENKYTCKTHTQNIERASATMAVVGWLDDDRLGLRGVCVCVWVRFARLYVLNNAFSLCWQL